MTLLAASFILFALVAYLAVRKRIEAKDIQRQIKQLDDTENFY